MVSVWAGLVLQYSRFSSPTMEDQDRDRDRDQEGDQVHMRR